MGLPRWCLLPLLVAVILNESVVSSWADDSQESAVMKRSGVHENTFKVDTQIHHYARKILNEEDEIGQNKTIKIGAVASRTKTGRKIIHLDNLKEEDGNKTSSDKKEGGKKARKNTLLLHKVGMTKIKTPAINHHRKRLASQSRKSHRGDSHVHIIKLPPNPYYYAHDKPIETKFDLSNQEKSIKPQTKQIQSGPNNVGLSFASNGKPSRIYHWNMPIMKKMLARKAGAVKNIDTLWDPITINEQSTLDTDDIMHHKVSYYRPKRPSKKTFNKYFPGNGKPQSLYVIEKSKKAIKYHRLLP